jgi:hypothetical protein
MRCCGFAGGVVKAWLQPYQFHCFRQSGLPQHFEGTLAKTSVEVAQEDCPVLASLDGKDLLCLLNAEGVVFFRVMIVGVDHPRILPIANVQTGPYEAPCDQQVLW